MPIEKNPKVDNQLLYRIDLLFNNFSENVTISAEESEILKTTYYNDLNSSPLHIRSFRNITYHNIYNGIDLKIYSQNDQIKYDYIVHPYADPNQISTTYLGCAPLSLDESGNCKINCELGAIKEEHPFTYQLNKQEIKSSYQIKGNKLSYSIGDYNKEFDLIIDPLLINWGRYFCTTADDFGGSVAVDNNGNAFMVGITVGAPIYPNLVGSLITPNGSSNCYIARYNASGTLTQYALFGGAGNDSFTDIAIDASNNAIVTGFYVSSGNQNAILLKFNNTCTLLGWLSFGGTGGEHANAVALDGNTAFIVGHTTSTNIPGTTGKFQTSYSGGLFDGFLASFNISANTPTLNWSTYYGSNQIDVINDVSVANNPNKEIIVCGGTKGSLPGAGTGSNNSVWDGYISVFNNQGTVVLSGRHRLNDGSNWFTYTAACNDNASNVYVTGYSTGQNGFSVSKYSIDVSSTTYFERNFPVDLCISTSYMEALGIVLDQAKNTFYVSGAYQGSTFPLCEQPAVGNATQASRVGVDDGIIVKLSMISGDILGATYVGSSATPTGSLGERLNAIAISPAGNIITCGWVLGNMNYANFGGTSYLGNFDAIIISFCLTPDNPEIVGPKQVCPSRTNVIYTIKHPQADAVYNWSLPSGVSFTAGYLPPPGNSTVSLDFSTTFASGSISIYASPAIGSTYCGNSATLTFPITSGVKGEYPPLRLNLDGPTCYAGSTILEINNYLNPHPVYIYEQFQWSKDGVILRPWYECNNSNSPSRIIANTWGTYKLESYDGCGNLVSSEVKLRNPSTSTFDVNTYASSFQFLPGITIVSNTSGITGYVFGGVITVPAGADVTLSNTNILMNSCTRIEVYGKLTIDNCDLYNCVGDWSGIVVAGSSGQIITKNNSIISDATEAISLEGDNTDISNTPFYNNVIHIGIKSNTGWTGTSYKRITNNTFLPLKTHPFPNFPTCFTPGFHMPFIGNILIPWALPASAMIYSCTSLLPPNGPPATDIDISGNRFFGHAISKTISSSTPTDNLENGIYMVQDFNNTIIKDNKFYHLLNAIQSYLPQYDPSSGGSNFFSQNISRNLFYENTCGTTVSFNHHPIVSNLSQPVGSQQNASISCNKYFRNTLGIVGSGDIIPQGNNNAESNNMFFDNLPLNINVDWDLIWERSGGSGINIWHGSVPMPVPQLNTLTAKSPYTLNNVAFNSMPPWSDYIENINASASLCRGLWKNAIKPIYNFTKMVSPQSIFSIYPNPALDFIIIDRKNNDRLHYQIIDLTGKMVLSSSIDGSEKINISMLKAGIYIITTTDELGKTNRVKFIKK